MSHRNSLSPRNALATTIVNGNDRKNTPGRSGSITTTKAVMIALASASLAALMTAFHITQSKFVHTFSIEKSKRALIELPDADFSQYDTHGGGDGRLSLTEIGDLLGAKANIVVKRHHENISLFEGRLQEPSFQVQSDGVDDGQPRVVWLMSFPNSGTSYTIHLTRGLSNSLTATNYALEGEIKDRPSVPVLNYSENGPYFEIIPNRNLSKPKYILTKTHCGGFCSDCSPEKYLETPRSFQTSCRSGRRAKATIKGLKLEPVTYNVSIVKKAIHVIRHPLDNIVARYHLFYDREKMSGNTNFTETHPYNSTGFHKWCIERDRAFNLTEARWIDKTLAATLEAVPCHQEFFRYIQWHNLAFTVSRDMALPTLIIHYSDYSDDFDATVERLLTFLELPRTGEGMPFTHGKEYRHYYTPEQRAAILNLLKEYSSAETWHYLKDYDIA